MVWITFATAIKALFESEALGMVFAVCLVFVVPGCFAVSLIKAHKRGKAEKVADGQPAATAAQQPVVRGNYVPLPQEPLKGWLVCKEMLEQSHLLVGGTTGAGKSTLAHSIIYTLATNGMLSAQFYGIDLKRVELAVWERLPHCQGIAKTPEAALETIKLVNQIVDDRLNIMEKHGQRTYLGGDMYLIIDELAELLAVNRKAVVDGLSRIMRLGRAAKVHVIGFTQAPNRSKGGGLDPLLCQNFTAAVALRCRSAIESRQIIGVAGAEKLPLHGFGLFWSSSGIEEIEIPMTSDERIAQRVAVWNR